MNRTGKKKSSCKKGKMLLITGILVLAALFVYLTATPLRQAVSSDNLAPAGAVAEQKGTASGKTMKTLRTMAVKNPKITPIVQNPGNYPQRLLDSLARNPELLDFTLNYPKKKGTFSKSMAIAAGRKGKIPLLMQWDQQWGYAPYGNGCIGLDGCGPTCLSMVAVGLTGSTALNPKAVADFSRENGYLDTGTGGTRWTLMSDGAKKLGLHSRELPLDENRMARELSDGHPIICSMRPGDFTTTGHFIVLCGYSGGRFTVNDPNSKSRSGKKWSYAVLKPQIRNLWAFSAL